MPWASDRRSAHFPDVPTLQEKGIKGPGVEYWQGIFLPQGASADVALFLSGEIAGLFKDSHFLQQLENSGFERSFKDCLQFKEFLGAEDQNYQRFSRNRGLVY